MTFYTRTGDDGSTGLLGNERVSKSSLRIECIGCLDETNAVFGIVRAQTQSAEIQELVLEIQKKLYLAMAEVAATPQNSEHFRSIDENAVNWLEQEIQNYSDKVAIPQEFIVPGDSPSGAFLSYARTMVRRSERRLAELFEKGELENTLLLRFLNRLSSLCFVLELFENKLSGKGSQTLVK
jgi:cob(I)alamin adenosyltransferase